MTLADRKDAARKAAFAARKAAHDMGQGHAGHLSAVLAGYRGVPLAGYAQMRTELDPTAAMAKASAHGPVSMPVIQAAGQPLKFREWTPECEMIDGPFGAQVPATGDFITPESSSCRWWHFRATAGDWAMAADSMTAP